MELINNPSNIEWDFYSMDNGENIEDILFLGTPNEANNWGGDSVIESPFSSNKKLNNIREAFINEFEPYRKILIDNIHKLCIDEGINEIHDYVMPGFNHFILLGNINGKGEIDLRTGEYQNVCIPWEHFDKIYWGRFRSARQKWQNEQYERNKIVR